MAAESQSADIPVWFSGTQRWMTGVTRRTTCDDVIYALLVSTGLHETESTDTFAIFEKWREVERPLSVSSLTVVSKVNILAWEIIMKKIIKQQNDYALGVLRLPHYNNYKTPKSHLPRGPFFSITGTLLTHSLTPCLPSPVSTPLLYFYFHIDDYEQGGVGAAA